MGDQHQRLRACALLLALTIVTLPLGGCVAIAAGAATAYGVVQYDRNETAREYDASLDDAWQAAVAELRRMGYPVQEGTSPGATFGELEINDISMRVERIGANRTRVSVRFGTFATEEHERRSRLLLDGIGERLT